VERLSVRHWADKRVVCGGRSYDNLDLPGFVARIDGRPAGFLTYHRKGRVMDLVSIACRVRRRGVGTALVRSLVRLARRLGCVRLRVAAVNSNREALGFYQSRGFTMTGVRRGAMARARRIKPDIPRVDANGIPIDHEVVLEKRLGTGNAR
jgi:GNAT superfamily N-acetyltransferase